MFTGIITAKADVTYVKQLKDGVQIGIKTPEGWNDLEIGESIAVDGVCLTVTSISPHEWTAVMIPETLAATYFGKKMPEITNLERALPLSHRLSGHIVQGHVDGVGRVQDIRRDDGYVIAIEFEGKDSGLVIHKGSVTVNGVSLTISAVHDNTFEISLIPHTLQSTTLGKTKVGDYVNIEYDVIGKYVSNLMKGSYAKN